MESYRLLPSNLRDQADSIKHLSSGPTQINLGTFTSVGASFGSLINTVFGIRAIAFTNIVNSITQYLYVMDTNNHRLVMRKASDLDYVDEIGSSGSGDDQFYFPDCLCSDDTHLFIADTSNNRIVKRLKSDLSYVSKVGSFGVGD